MGSDNEGSSFKEKSIEYPYLKCFFSEYLKPQKYFAFISVISVFLVSYSIINLANLSGNFINYKFLEDVNGSSFAGDFLFTISILFSSMFMRIYFSGILGERVSASMRRDFIFSIISKGQRFFDENNFSKINSSMVHDISTIQSGISTTLPIALRSFIVVIGSILMLLITDFKLSLVLFSSIILSYTFFRGFLRKVRESSKEMSEVNLEFFSSLSEYIQNVKTIQSFGMYGIVSSYFEKTNNNYYKLAKKYYSTKAQMVSLVMLFIIINIGLIFSYVFFSKAGSNIMLGDMTSFFFYAFLIMSSLNSVSDTYGNGQKVYFSIGRIISNVKDKFSTNYTLNGKNEISIDKIKGSLVMKELYFYYPSRPEINVLSNLSIGIPAGHKVALVGHSGAGKSTIFDLIMGFYDNYKGSIEIDDIDIKEIDPENLRNLISVVEQEPAIFSCSIRENVSYGKQGATFDEIKEVCRNAYIYDFIENLPEGFDTKVGERGMKLSVGQKQRIAIARAMLKESKILLLDEATSALDSESEKNVQMALDRLGKGKTSIAIAHRISTILDADRIIFLDKGRVTGVGTHQELMESNKDYANLVNIQFREERN